MTPQIFDPNYYLIDRDSGAVYRKEHFDAPGALCQLNLSSAIVVTRIGQITGLCERAGLTVLESRPVRAGRLEQASLAESDASAREILVLVEKPFKQTE